ncbi:ribonucleases P/MRP protein subunit POP1-like isoform X1 [Apium graveolens]|uniref:ribonucleases P/MRP protein subunit POP1-like isoform X1 n=2 Tax=Apium graveolens TaxID=4045 RepID=UPI003D7C0D41
MAATVTKHPQTPSTALPRSINVTRFAECRGPELEALHSIVSERLNGDFRSNRNKRRRTTGYDNRVGKKRFRKRQNNGVVDFNKKVPRRIRRKNELRRNESVGFGVSGDGTKRLRTHVWHAKRFTMSKIWGFYLPLGLHGKGRGSRSIMKSLRDGVVVHDASYCSAVQLEGPEENLLSILSTVLVPSEADSEVLSRKIISGVAFGIAMLHHGGATCSHTISPVTYMWRPHVRSAIKDVEKSDGLHDAETIDNSSALRLVWIWIHAAAFKEGFDAVECASRRENEKVGGHVNCISLESQLGKVEVMGSKASQLLQKILHPVKSFPQNNMDLKECSVDETQDEPQLNIFYSENEDCTSSSIISLVVNDPRIVTGKAEDQTSAGIQDSILESVSSPCFRNGESMNLWHAANGIYPPVEESILCREKYHQRMAFYCLNDQSSSMLNEPSKEQCSTVCPILLLKNSHPKNSIVRWSIILPISWVKAFWIPLLSLGGRAIGLREKHWIACEVGLPYFPSDFPGCSAYSCFMENEAADSVRDAELRPPSVKPFCIPISPPWDVVSYAFNKKKITGSENHIFPDILSSENMNNLATNSHKDFHRDPCCKNGVSFDGLVPRSARLLARFLSGINNCELHLFPSMPERKSCINKIMKDIEISKQGLDDNILVNYDHKLCFIRILIHAYKDGVFEDGAVVCAPHISDLAFMTSRLDNKFELKIPDTLLRSYFVQQPTGKWDLQEPSDPAGKESHRWPIGFVTTGFVHGSKKSVAGAFCEAVLLARLREEQWNAVPAKRRKEIYVLVRNLRSTAYRLALAEIVLEQHEQDVEYM